MYCVLFSNVNLLFFSKFIDFSVIFSNQFQLRNISNITKNINNPTRSELIFQLFKVITP